MGTPIKKAFIVLTHHYTPSKTERGKVNVVEKCEFVDNLKNRMYTEATVIVDYMNKNIIKCRIEGATMDQLMTHIKTKHPGEYKKFEELMAKGEK